MDGAGRSVVRAAAFAGVALVVDLGVAPESLPDRLAEREALERGLGVSAGITSELLSRIIVAGPVVTGAVTLLISSR